MKRKSIGFKLILFGISILLKSNISFAQPFGESNDLKANPLFSGLHTLSIHVKDTVIHDSVFHFLIDKLKMPVYYNPVKFGSRKYAGVYAGNLILEPCGPYSYLTYATDNFKAIFYGFTFEPFESLVNSKTELEHRKILCTQADDSFIYLYNDSVLCGGNMTISFMDRIQKMADKKIMDSLRYAMNSEKEVKYKVYNVYTEETEELKNKYTLINYYNDLGIEYVQDICLGYDNDLTLQKWKAFVFPSELNSNSWECDSLLSFHFVKGKYKEIQSITFKVKSLEQTKRYLSGRNLNWNYINNKILLDTKQTFGLLLYFTETRTTL